jgi:hypothetical protein
MDARRSTTFSSCFLMPTHLESLLRLPVIPKSAQITGLVAYQPGASSAESLIVEDSSVRVAAATCYHFFTKPSPHPNRKVVTL